MFDEPLTLRHLIDARSTGKRIFVTSRTDEVLCEYLGPNKEPIARPGFSEILRRNIKQEFVLDDTTWADTPPALWLFIKNSKRGARAQWFISAHNKEKLFIEIK